MIGKIGMTPAFRGKIEITPRKWINPAMCFDTDEIKHISGQSNGDTKIEMFNGDTVNVLEETATMNDILSAYAAAKNSNLTVTIHNKEN